MSPSKLLRAWSFFALLSLVVVACGGSAPAARGPAPLVVGKGNASAVAPALPVASAEDDVAVPISTSDATRGSREAPVTIVVFSDLQCPFCARLAPTLDRIIESNGPQKIRLVFKNNPLPFHPHARKAAEAGRGVLALAGNDGFWKFHDLAFKSQREMNLETIIAWAKEAGADDNEIRAGLEQGRWAPKVDADVDLASRIGALGTPTSFVNGVVVSGAQPYEKFANVIAAELEKASTLSSQGVAKDRIYARLVEANFKQPSKRDTHDDDDDDDDSADAKQVWKATVGTAPVRGSNQALVTIVEFSDFQCPFCKRVEPTLEQVRKAYGDKVRIVWRDEPLSFHPRAEPAAELARAARAQKGDAGFWAMHDLLFDSQPKLEDADLEALAKKAGLDVQKAMGQVRAKAFKKQIDEDADLGDDLKATGTPHFFVNGRRLVGAQPFDKFKSLIDEEMTKAEGLLKAGTPRAALYETIIKNGQAGEAPERKSIAAAPANAPFRGAANAKVVIQEVSDFQCPFCAKVESTLDELLKAYPGKVKIVWRDHPLPMHADAQLAAEAAREAHAQKGNEGFLKMHKLLFANQRALKRSDLDGYAKQIGLDMTKFASALDGRTHKPVVDADEKATTDAGASGTPAFFIGPYYLSGAQPIAKFRKLVDRVLAEPAPTPGGPARTIAGGLVVKDVSVGNGREAKAGDKLSVHYVGTLEGGKEFDSSRKRGTPFTFEIGKGHVIKGWEQGVVGMKVGGTRKLTIPPDLAYGDRGVPNAIPPKSTLYFDVELVSIQTP